MSFHGNHDLWWHLITVYCQKLSCMRADNSGVLLCVLAYLWDSWNLVWGENGSFHFPLITPFKYACLSNHRKTTCRHFWSFSKVGSFFSGSYVATWRCLSVIWFGGHNLLFESFGASVQHQAGVERAEVLELMCLCLPEPEAGSHLASSKGHHIPCRAVAAIGARIHRSCV